MSNKDIIYRSEVWLTDSCIVLRISPVYSWFVIHTYVNCTTRHSLDYRLLECMQHLALPYSHHKVDHLITTTDTVTFWVNIFRNGSTAHRYEDYAHHINIYGTSHSSFEIFMIK